MFRHQASDRAEDVGTLCCALAIIACACAGSPPSSHEDARPGDATDGGDAAIIIEVAPGDVVLTVDNGVPAAQAFTAVAHLSDGSSADVTSEAEWSIANPRLGSIDGSTFTAGGTAGGLSTVLARWHGAVGEASVTVKVKRVRAEEGLPAEVVGWFAAASPDPARAPTIVYPSPQTMFPPNIGYFEVHWTDGAGNNVFEMVLSSDFLELGVITSGTINGGAFAAFSSDEWQIVRESQRGSDLHIQVLGLATDQPGTFGASAPLTVRLAEQDIRGGLYYWSASSTTGAPQGIYRHDIAKPEEPAEGFYTTVDSGGTCSACHGLSRDGTKIAIALQIGNTRDSALLDVSTRAVLYQTGTIAPWTFATFSASGTRMVTAHAGVMTLRDTMTGAVWTTVPTEAWATQPDFSPRGDAIVYVVTNSPLDDAHFPSASLVVQPFDAVTDTFGAPREIVVADTQPVYFPSWSPDGEWIVFNKSTGDSYADDSAQLYVVKADGSLAPILLATPNIASGLTNSWPRFAPFAQTTKSETGDEEPLFWLTFGSRRAFGVRLPQDSRSQLWMAPFFPARAGAGLEPSAPAFRLPFQNLDSANHSAQWTEEVVEVL